LTEGGVPIYSNKLSAIIQHDDVLFAGFLSAINMFIQESFSSVAGDTGIKTLIQKSTAILIESTLKFSVVSIVKKESYEQRRKLQQLTQALKSEKVLDNLSIKNQPQAATDISRLVAKIYQLSETSK
jgi:hypothetical protein